MHLCKAKYLKFNYIGDMMQYVFTEVLKKYSELSINNYFSGHLYVLVISFLSGQYDSRITSNPQIL